MGIKHFFHWFKREFADNIYQIKKGETFEDIDYDILDEPIEIDNFMIDMNGLFHSSAQKIYEYGEHKPRQRLLGVRKPRRRNGLKVQLDCFRDICDSVDKCLEIVKPRKRLILCVDGPAPLSKQNQQRQRRFMSSTNSQQGFDSNSITPGTKFMDYLTKYIDWYIRMKMSESKDSLWNRLEVIFSNEKAPGEGEYKCLHYIRRFGDPEESYCIHGMDADLIMLTLGTHLSKFYILREEPRDPSFDFHVIDIGGVHRGLTEKMIWDTSKSKYKFMSKNAINDFIFMCFTVGNDFLPHIPGLEIIEGGINFMLEIYRDTCQYRGHLTKTTQSGVKFRKKSLAVFLEKISTYEKGVLEEKLLHKGEFYPDKILESNAEYIQPEDRYELNIQQYREDYYEINLPDCKDMERLCHDYLEGMQWVLSYYTKGVPNWRWRFPYHYAPFAHTLSKYVKTFKFSVYGHTMPTVPFVQLLSVLPPSSSQLLPSPLNDLLKSKDSPISEFYPEKFDVDLSGKRQDWEGVVLLPIVDYNKIEQEYFKYIKDVDSRENKRNTIGKTFVYTRTDESSFFRSYYGDLQSRVSVNVIEL